MGFMCCFMMIIGGFALWNLVSPQSAWQVLFAWRYKNPEAHEPSEAGYAVQRVVGAVALVTVIAAGLMIATAFRQAGP